MLFLTHLLFAQNYAKSQQIIINDEFNLGVIIPDIRCLFELSRIK